MLGWEEKRSRRIRELPWAFGGFITAKAAICYEWPSRYGSKSSAFMGLVLITLYQFWTSQEIVVHPSVCKIKRRSVVGGNTGIYKTFFQTLSSLEMFLARCRDYSARSARLGTCTFLNWMWILSNLLFREKNNRLKRRLIFQRSESSLCADKLIVCFTFFEQGTHCSVCRVICISLHYTLVTKETSGHRWTQRWVKGLALVLWLKHGLVIGPDCHSCDTMENAANCVDGAEHIFPRDVLSLDSVESYLNLLTHSYLNFIQTAQSKPLWIEWLPKYTKCIW